MPRLQRSSADKTQRALDLGEPWSHYGVEAKINQSSMCNNIIQPSIYNCITVKDVEDAKSWHMLTQIHPLSVYWDSCGQI